MLTIQIIDNVTDVSATAQIPAAHASAFKSAVAEMRNELGERLAGAHNYGKEDALTKAASAFGIFAGALHRVVEREDRDYA